MNSAGYSKAQVSARAPAHVDRKSWQDSLASHSTFVAGIDGEIVGFADLTGAGYINRLYVHNCYQCRGTGKHLLSSIEARVKALGGGRLYTHASITAKPFLQRKDFCW